MLLMGGWRKQCRQHAEHGSLWAKISKLLGRYTYNITDKWRDLKLIATHKTGLIQQSELERVASLVYKFARTKSLLRNEDAKEDRREVLNFGFLHGSRGVVGQR